jgi:hypothetical protein
MRELKHAMSFVILQIGTSRESVIFYSLELTGHDLDNAKLHLYKSSKIIKIKLNITITGSQLIAFSPFLEKGNFSSKTSSSLLSLAQFCT